MKDLVILGGGVSGIGSALLAKKNGFNVFVSDKGDISDQGLLIKNDIQFEEGSHNDKRILEANLVIKSPGVPNNTPIIKDLKCRDVPIISEIEFAYTYTKAKIIAVTGTNGKTTTTLLIGHILKKAGYDVLVAGNIGTSFAGSICNRDYDYIVLEISSFQLDDTYSFKSHISIILNISPDHLERYGYSFDNYISSKLKILNNQNDDDFVIYNYDDSHIRDRIRSEATLIPFSLNHGFESYGAFYQSNKININIKKNNMTIEELSLQGKHNLYNSMAAAAAGRVLEVKDFVIRQSLLDFENIEHRLEHVLNVHGIEFINDSKATNINSVWYALESMTKDIIWIAGGVDKGNDYNELSELVREKVKSIICIGESKSNLHEAFKGDIDNILDVNTMSEAVFRSYEIASQGDVVLLSPACASFDMFENYEHRGIEFKKYVRSL